MSVELHYHNNYTILHKSQEKKNVKGKISSKLIIIITTIQTAYKAFYKYIK